MYYDIEAYKNQSLKVLLLVMIGNGLKVISEKLRKFIQLEKFTWRILK